MRLKQRIKLAKQIIRHGDAAIWDYVEAVLEAEKKKPQEQASWFGEQRLLRFERDAADRRARQPWILHHNFDVGWREAQLPARWFQSQ